MGKILLVIVVFAAIVYSVFWLIERRRSRSTHGPSTIAPASYPRVLGPDDDEDFLRELERRRRRAARDKSAKPEKQPKPDEQRPEQKPRRDPDRSE